MFEYEPITISSLDEKFMKIISKIYMKKIIGPEFYKDALIRS